MKPIGIDLPIRRGNQGFFQQTYTTDSAIKSNIKNLLLTNFGERPLNPTFGNNLRRFVFEQDVQVTQTKIEETIRDVIAKNFNSILVDRVVFDEIKDDNKILLSIFFSLVSFPNLIDRISLEIKTGN
jgi:phage baseplate assembly protein W